MLSKFKWGVTFFMVSLLALIGCQSEKMVDDMGSQTGQTVTLIAKHASGSRTAIKNGKTEWVVGDKIYVSSRNGDARGTLTCKEINTEGNGVFTGQIMGTLEGKQAYSVYPAPVNGKTINLAGTTGAQYPNAPMIGVIDNEGCIEFKNTCGVLYLNLNGVQGETLEISASNGNTPISLAAKADVTNCWPVGDDYAEPALSFENPSKTIKIYNAHGGEMYVPFYIADCNGLSDVKFKVGTQVLNKEGGINLSSGFVGKLVKNNIATFTLSENGKYYKEVENTVTTGEDNKTIASSTIAATDFNQGTDSSAETVTYFTVSASYTSTTSETKIADKVAVTLPKVENTNQTAEISFTDMASVETITISEAENNTGHSIEELTVVIPSDITAEQAQQTVTITMPYTTVTVKSADGNVLFIQEMTAETAENTLVVEKGVKIERLKVKKGRVKVFGEIEELIHEAQEGVVIDIYIMESGHITTPPDSNKFNVLFQTQGVGHSTTAGGNGFENGGIFFKTSNDSRASIELGNQAEDGESFDWKEGDKFTLIEIVGDSQPEVTVTPKVHEFTISDSYSNDSPSGGADFTSPTALTYLAQFVAFYPVVKEDESGYNFYFNNTLKDNSAESWNNYFKNNMFMKATGNSVPSDQMGLNFQQMCSLIRITYTNATDTDREIKKISVDGSWGSGFHVDKNTLECGASSGYGGDYGVEFTDGATIAKGESEDFYILYYPYKQYNSVTSSEDLQLMETIFVTLENNHQLRTENYPFGDKRPDFFNGTGKRFWFSVTETADGLKWTDSLNEEPGEGDETGSVIITNNVLAEALWTEYSDQYQMSRLENGSVEMTREVANSISALDFDSDKYTFTTLEGIENFTNLETLICYNQNIASIDLSQNTALTELNIQGWESLKSLDLSNNTLLERLSVTYSQITELDLQKNTKLTQLTLYNNEQLKTVKVSTSCTTLEHLDLSGAKMLETLSVPNPGKVYYLHYNDTKLSFDLSTFKGLISLDCSGKPNDFEKLSTEAKAKLERLHCIKCNLITSLDLTGYTALKHLNCSDNQLESLVLENLSLESLVVNNNLFTEIDLTKSKGTLQEFYCNNNKLKSLNLEGFAALRHLSANTNELVSMDVTGCSQLFTVQCGWNKLTELDLRASKFIDYLICGSQNNQEPLVLKLDASLHNRWYDEWLAMAIKGENGNVTLWTGVDAGSGNTGANDFPIIIY